MANELKATVINMKTLSQDITDPVVVGAGDAAGRTLRIIFTQEAAAQFTPNTKVYLSWHHQEKNIKGYNVFTEITDEEDEDFPPTWEIKYPKSMLYEGNALACIQIVDDVSIATSTNFMIHILIDPNDGSSFIASDDFSEFQRAVITLTNIGDQARAQMTAQKIEFEDMQLAFMRTQQIAENAEQIAEEAQRIAENALGTASEALETIEDFTVLARELQEKEQQNEQRIEAVEDIASQALDRADAIAENILDVAAAVREVAEQITDIECDCGMKEEEVIALINQKLENYATKDEIQNFLTADQVLQLVGDELLAGYATTEEVDGKLETLLEEAQGEHQEIWDALTVYEFDDDGEG